MATLSGRREGRERQRGRGEPESALYSGYEALAQGEWKRAHTLFMVAMNDHESVEALEGLGKAAWWLSDPVTVFAARERAYGIYRQGGDKLRAARMALHLGIDHCSLRGAYALGSAWLQRAERLLEGQEPAPEHAWLALWKGQVAMVLGDDWSSAYRHSACAADLARSLGLLPLEGLAVAQEGLVLLREGDVASAVRLNPDVDVVLARDVDHLDLVVTTCSELMRGWEQVRDFEPIEQWWALLDNASQCCPAPPCLLWMCRIYYAAALIWRGAWDQGEVELERAVDSLTSLRGEMAAEAMVRLANLRRLRGRYEESAVLLEAAESQPVRIATEAEILLGWANVALDEGDPAASRRLAEEALTVMPGAHPAEGLAGLELLLRAEVRLGKPNQVHRALSELQRATCSVPTDGIRASARFCEGVVALAAGAFDVAGSRLQEAVDLFQRASAHFETARARVELAVVLSELGEHEAARREATAATKALYEVGAAREADRAEPRLRRVKGKPGTERGASPGGLTSRELEILRLVADGQSNQAIAAQLIVSVRTVESHLSKIYDKVGASGKVARATAIAYGLRHGLVSS